MLSIQGVRLITAQVNFSDMPWKLIAHIWKKLNSFSKFDNSSKNLSISSCDIERNFSKFSLIKAILTYGKDNYLSFLYVEKYFYKIIIKATQYAALNIGK